MPISTIGTPTTTATISAVAPDISVFIRGPSQLRAR
jgi:hypothetical protein